MASIRIIHAVTDGKGGRRPRSNRRRVEKPLPKTARQDQTPKRKTPRKRPKRESVPAVKLDPKSIPETLPLVRQALPLAHPVPQISSGPLASWDPEIAEAILLAVAAYNELRRSDPELKPVGTI